MEKRSVVCKSVKMVNRICVHNKRFIPSTPIINYQPHSTVGSKSDSRATGPGFDTQSGHILSLLLPLIQEGQLSVTGKSM